MTIESEILFVVHNNEAYSIDAFASILVGIYEYHILNTPHAVEELSITAYCPERIIFHYDKNSISISPAQVSGRLCTNEGVTVEEVKKWLLCVVMAKRKRL